jgi:PAS domain S-box-containing protein
MAEMFRLNQHTTLEDLYRHTLLFTRDVLHLERCRIVILENEKFVHVCGMDLSQNISDERGMEAPISPEIRQFILSGFPDLYDVIENSELSAMVDGAYQTVGRGWLGCTPIYSTQKKIIALLFNDTAISHTPVNHTKQLITAFFCSYLGAIAELHSTKGILHDTKRLYQNLIHQLPAVTYVLELGSPREDFTQQRTVYISPQVKDVFGYTDAEWLADQDLWRRLLHPDDQKRVLDEIQQAHITGSNFRLEYRALHRNGSEIWIHEQALYPNLSSPPDPLRIQGCMFDITQEKRASEDQKMLQQKLAKAARMESIGLLAGSVAHDLNNILGPVIGYPDLLLDEIPNCEGQVKKDLESVRDSAQDAADVIQDLLSLARRENYELAVIDLNQQVRALLESASFGSILLNNHPHTEIHTDILEVPLCIEASIPHLNKLLRNLIINASEAMEEDGEITVATSIQKKVESFGNVERIEPGEYACLSVGDEGPGLNIDNVAQIFEPFYTTKNLGRSGTGLGLSVVYGVVKDFFGYIDVESNPAEGTRFSIYIPISKKGPDEPIDEPMLPKGRGQVLVIDDIPEQRTLAGRLLTRLGYEPDYAIHGHDALEYFKRGKRPDILMLDMVMEPGFDGLDTYRAILELAPGQKCLIVSGFSANERVQEAIDLGAGMYISKPYSLQKLDLALRRVLYAANPA